MEKLAGTFTPGSSEIHATIEAHPNDAPFRTELSLAPLIRFWSEAFDDDNSPKSAVAAIIRREAEKAPELTRPVEDLEVFHRHAELMHLLMAAAFPPAFFGQEYGAALVPFELRTFYATPPFERMLMAEDGHLRGRVNLDPASLGLKRTLSAYRLILRRVYGLDLEVEYPLIVTTDDPDTGLERHFKVEFDQRFLDVETMGEVPPLDEDARRKLHANLLDRKALAAILPVDRFVIRGFTIFRAFDVTDQEVVSSIKRDLIEKAPIVSTARFQELQAKLRTLFRRPDLRFGLAAVQGDQVLMLNCGVELEHSCIFADSVHRKTVDFEGSIYARAFVEQRAVVVDDLAERTDRTWVEDLLVESGVRNIIVAPLHYGDDVIGTLELSSPHRGDLDPGLLPKLREVLPLFSMAVQRSMEELDNRIEAFIKEKFTAIHPAVEWRFRKAVLDTIERTRANGGAQEMEPIVFEKVFPLYALSDIRGSSTQRATAIQADMLAQLRLARDVLRAASAARPLPILDELVYRTDSNLSRTDAGLSSGDEVGILGFLRTEIEPLFDHLKDFGPAVSARIEAYRAALDPRLGVVYDQRRHFEASVAELTDALSAYVDLEEQAAQEMYPHYFEKQKTDGVDYQIYVGGSLVEGGEFDPLYLKNLRLWQLMVTCGAAVRADQLRPRLPLPLEMTHLILVQQAPLSIRFRFDEKRFDVDGAYDIRYEIVKKRIDKAHVRGTTERVTQPGKIVIVYGNVAEAKEYRRYVEYLQSRGYLKPEVEDIELEELQGVHGLRALRVSVDLHNPTLERGSAAHLLGASERSAV